MTRAYVKVWAHSLLIAGVLGLVALIYFVSAETVGTTFATGSGNSGLELLIDSKTYYNNVLQPRLSWSLKDLKPGTDRFFKFKDVKPGDTGTNTISIHIKKNPAWVCLDFLNLKDTENGRNEPEGHVDPNNTGELSKELEFFAWRDDGDNKFEVGEKPLFGTSTQNAFSVLKGKSYPLADSKNGTAYQKDATKYIGVVWCAGDLTVNVATAQIGCNGETMGNEAQTDSMTLDVAIRAVASKDEPKFLCSGGKDDHDDHGHHDDDDHHDDDHHGGGGHDDDDDDNHHDDDYHIPWHYPTTGGHWDTFVSYCKNAFKGWHV